MEISILQSILTAYRVPVFKALANRLKDEYSIKVIATNAANKELELQHELIKVYKWWKFKITPSVNGLAKKADILVIMFDIHWISYMLLLFGNKKYKVVLWGHGITNSNNKISALIRRRLAKKADALLFYNEERRIKFCYNDQELLEKSFVAQNTQIIGNAGINLKSDKNSILYVGRLNHKKRTSDLIYAYNQLETYLKEKYKLIIVGDGVNIKMLQELAVSLDISSRIVFTGALYNEDELKKYFDQSICYVLPGTVGLGVVNSFAYGVPAIVPINRNHGPEFTYCNEGNTFFYNDSISELKECLEEVLRDDQVALIKGREAYEYYKKYLTKDNFINGFRDAIHFAERN